MKKQSSLHKIENNLLPISDSWILKYFVLKESKSYLSIPCLLQSSAKRQIQMFTFMLPIAFTFLDAQHRVWRSSQWQMIWENGSNFSEIEIKQHMFFVVIAHLFISGPLSLSLSYLGGLLINLSLKNIFLILYTIISDIPSLFSLFFFWYFCHNYL